MAPTAYRQVVQTENWDTFIFHNAAELHEPEVSQEPDGRWVIKNGSAGTGMVPLIGTAITEEEAWYVINYERSFEGK